jgi:Peroxidase
VDASIYSSDHYKTHNLASSFFGNAAILPATCCLTVTAIKTMNGPTIPWSSGRVDEIDPSAVTPDGRLPNADVGPSGADNSDASHLRDIFYRMGKCTVLL